MSDTRRPRPTLRPLILALALVFLFLRMGRAEWVQTLTAESPRTAKIFDLAALGPDTLFVAFESGVFRSFDRGNNWTQVRNGMAGFSAVFSLAARGNTVFAGTVGNGGAGNGVFRSYDYGSSWSPTALKDSYLTVLTAIDGAVLAGSCCNGLYRSADDGATWTRPIAESLYVKDIAVGGAFLFAGTARGLYRSSDQGVSWTHLAFSDGLSDSVIGPIAALGNALFAGTYHGLYRSDDHGGSWTRAPLAAQYIQTLAVSDRDLFVGFSEQLHRSQDSGRTWIRIDSGLTARNVMCLTVAGGNLFAGISQAGVWRRPLSEIGTAIVPRRASGSNANAGYSGSFRGPGFIPGWTGVLQTDPRTGFRINGRRVALPQRLPSSDRLPLSK